LEFDITPLNIISVCQKNIKQASILYRTFGGIAGLVLNCEFSRIGRKIKLTDLFSIASVNAKDLTNTMNRDKHGNFVEEA